MIVNDVKAHALASFAHNFKLISLGFTSTKSQKRPLSSGVFFVCELNHNLRDVSHGSDCCLVLLSEV